MNRSALLAQLRTIPQTQRVITALDLPAADAAVDVARRLGPSGRLVKVGLQLFSAARPEIITRLQAAGMEIFLDLKYHDIPNTVAGAARVAADLGVAMITIHTTAGRPAMQAAAEALAGAAGDRRPALLGVTVLTSLTGADLAEIAPADVSLGERVVRLAGMAWQCGCDGVVCAPTDLDLLRGELGDEPLAVTPGIRPAAADHGDQRRVATPAAAIAAGADFLVVGRPITGANDPGLALGDICREMAS